MPKPPTFINLARKTGKTLPSNHLFGVRSDVLSNYDVSGVNLFQIRLGESGGNTGKGAGEK